MTKGFARANFIGRVGFTELKQIREDLTIFNISIAVDQMTVEDGNKVSKTAWYRIATFDKLANALSQFVVKGHLLYVSADIRQKTWVNKEDVKQLSTDFIATEVKVLSSKSSNSDPNANKQSDFIEFKDLLRDNNDKKETHGNNQEDVLLF